MKNFKHGKIVVSAIVIVIVIMAFFVMCSNGGTQVPADSVIAGAEGYLYYNDMEDNIVRRALSDGKETIISENAVLLDAYMNEVLVQRDRMLSVMTAEGEATGFEYRANVGAEFRLTADYIYYKDNETGSIARIVRETGEIESVISVAVDKFAIYSNKVVFTTDGQMLFLYDMDTKMPTGYFGNKAIVDFDIDEDCVVYSDANDGYKVSKFDLVNGKESVIKGVKSKTIEFKNGRLFYLDDIGGKKKSYTLKVNDFDVHKG